MDLNPAAVEAAAKAMFKRDYAALGAQWFTRHDPEQWHRDLALRAVEAAYPIITEAVVRATADAIADQIEAEARQTGEAIRREAHEFSAALVQREAFGLNLAARIARSFGSTAPEGEKP